MAKTDLDGRIASGQWSSDVPALREILQRNGVLDNSPAIPLPGDNVGKTKKAAKSGPAAYDRQLVDAVKRFQAAQGLGADGVIGHRRAIG